MTRTEAEKAVREPEPGSLWIYEKEHIRWIYIAQDGTKAISIAIRRSTGQVLKVDLDAYIHNECLEIIIKETVNA